LNVCTKFLNPEPTGLPCYNAVEDIGRSGPRGCQERRPVGQGVLREGWEGCVGDERAIRYSYLSLMMLEDPINAAVEIDYHEVAKQWQWLLSMLPTIRKWSCCEDCIEIDVLFWSRRRSLTSESPSIVKEHSRTILHNLAETDFWHAPEIRRPTLCLLDCRRLKRTCEIVVSCRLSAFIMLARAWHCVPFPDPNFCRNHSWSILSTSAFLVV